MSEIPKYVQEALIKAAKYHSKARQHQEVFESWLIEKFGEDISEDDGIRDALVDCVEQSNNPNEAIKRIYNLLEELRE